MQQYRNVWCPTDGLDACFRVKIMCDVYMLCTPKPSECKIKNKNSESFQSRFVCEKGFSIYLYPSLWISSCDIMQIGLWCWCEKWRPTWTFLRVLVPYRLAGGTLSFLAVCLFAVCPSGSQSVRPSHFRFPEFSVPSCEILTWNLVYELVLTFYRLSSSFVTLDLLYRSYCPL